MVQKTQGDYSPKEREAAILRSAIYTHLREFWSEAQSPHLTEEGNFFIKTIFPEPITGGELEVMLTPLFPGQEFNFCDYVKEMEALLIQEPSPLEDQPLYQHLTGRLEKLAKMLDDYDLTLTNFHTLLGIYILNVGVEQGLISQSEKRNYFRRTDISL